MNSGDGERIWKLQTSANALVLEGKREADSYIQFLQNFVFGKDLGCELWLEAHKALGLEKEYLQGIKQLKFPAVDQNLWWLPMVQGVTSNKIVAGHRRFGVKYWLYADDLDTAVPIHDRDANRSGSYIVGFRRYVEADEEFANKSASQLITVNHKGITLPERLILGAGYHVATGQHLDVKNWTMAVCVPVPLSFLCPLRRRQPAKRAIIRPTVNFLCENLQWDFFIVQYIRGKGICHEGNCLFNFSEQKGSENFPATRGEPR